MQWLIDLVKDAVGIPPVFFDRGTPGGFDWGLLDLTFDWAWHDLDLSSIVPAGAKTVLFSLYLRNDNANAVVNMRNKDNTGSHNVSRTFTQSANLYFASDIVCGCDSNRVIEYRIITAGWNYFYLTVKGWWL